MPHYRPLATKFFQASIALATKNSSAEVVAVCVAMQHQQPQRRNASIGVASGNQRHHQQQQHQRRRPLPPPTASHSADSLTSGMQRLSVSNRRGLTTAASNSAGKAVGAKPTTAAATSVRRRTIGSGNGVDGQPPKPGQVTSLADVANLLSNGRVSNIVVMAGAGISTASGIPDFRTPGTGLYDNLKQFKIPYPEAIFDLDYFFVNPKPFFALAKELYPSGRYRPNLVHCFCRLLHDKGMLSRVYTQNIDGLERLAGIPPEKLVEAHGTFATATCTHCCRQLPAVYVRPMILQGQVPICSKLRGQGVCPGVLKPDIVFFGEDLPARFWHYLRDFAHCDLLIVLGTSLQVEPFAGIVDSTRLTVPRLLINRDAVGPFRGAKPRRPNDLAATGDLVERVLELANLAGWSDELVTLSDRINLDIDACPDPFESNNNNSNNSPTPAQTRPQHHLPPLPHAKQQPSAKPATESTTSVANSNNNARRALEAGNNKSVIAAAVRVKPGIPLVQRHKRSQSQQRRQPPRQLSTSSSSSSSCSSPDSDSTSSGD
ncbi:hypothetical protein BOX15_Mlig023715g2 [Macrostomum lignano]|uniref:Deacetylase sirtuin-type domain-containing protein n=2 Tax=Macrostomum lignano TaxID=282301 RepID=A0A267H5U9_9PLAT|nr:hypothetical protein BOX15_Mlig023715g2 [Macrostomum lignano]